MPRVPLPLDLFGEVTTADGTRFRWDANQPATSRVQNLSFSTKIGEGFSSATGQLARRIDLDYPDLNLVDTVTFRGADGSVAWEGRMSAMPHQVGDKHSISLTMTGWMAHAKDRKFSEIYVDRDLGSWGDMSAQRRAALLLANNSFVSGPQMQPDPINNEALVQIGWTGAWASGRPPIAETWYDAGPDARVGKLMYSWQRQGGISAVDTAYTWDVRVSDDDILTNTEQSGNLQAAGPSLGQTYDPVGEYRFALLQLMYSTTPAGADGIEYSIGWKNLAVYGAHQLTTYAGEPGQPEGVLASDVIRHIASKWCPQLSTEGIQSTSYVIQHLAFKDRTFPFDAFLEINKYHLWNLAVWENKTLHFEPYNLLDYDWEIRTDQPGTTFEPQGPSIDDVFNGIAVTYTDALKGTKNVLTPELYPDDLGSSDPENPWNMHGVPHWDEIELSTPTTVEQALQIGRAAMGDRSVAKTPGSITVSGYLRDRAGNDQPAWKVRAGDTIAITNFPNSEPRLIVETSYDDETKQLSMSIDRPFALIDAYLDRVTTAVDAKGLK